MRTTLKQGKEAEERPIASFYTPRRQAQQIHAATRVFVAFCHSFHTKIGPVNRNPDLLCESESSHSAATFQKPTKAKVIDDKRGLSQQHLTRTKKAR
mmetsp:Transcript_49004/g.98609  ORF Transcript_49004/g.98609 Transcript_49004/m.98609 type:complete len:97 (-) Transcript_49004:1101-1391(-)